MLFAEYGTAAEWSVAGGTLLLALATFALAWGARKQVALAADHVVAIQRPVVAPIVTPEWATDVRSDVEVDWIMLKNVGLGPAYNVKGCSLLDGWSRGSVEHPDDAARIRRPADSRARSGRGHRHQLAGSERIPPLSRLGRDRVADSLLRGRTPSPTRPGAARSSRSSLRSVAEPV